MSVLLFDVVIPYVFNVFRAYTLSSPYISKKIESSAYILPLIIWIYLRYFSGGLRKTILFLQERRFSRSRSSKVIDFGANRKHAFDFLLVRHNNLGPILHRFGDIAGFGAPEPTLIPP